MGFDLDEDELRATKKKKTLENKIKDKIEYYQDILNSSIIKGQYKVEVNNIIRVLKELLDK